MLCLQARINSVLQSFVESWNNHSMSSEGSRTPVQMCLQGFIETNQLPVQPTSAHIQGNSQQLAVSAGDHVQVPRIRFKPCTFLLLLRSVIDPSQPSKQFGCDIYLRTIEIVGDHLQSECSVCIS